MLQLLYIGKKSDYFNAFQAEISKSGEVSVEIRDLEEVNEDVLLKTLKSSKFKLCIFDLNCNEVFEDNILSEFIKSVNYNRQIFISVKSENLFTKKELINKSVLGEIVYFFKGPELYDILNFIYTVFEIKFEKKKFATAIYQEFLSLNYLIIFTAMRRTQFEFESNYNFSKKSKFNFELPIRKDLIQSSRHLISEKSNFGHRTKLSYSYVGDIQFLTRVIKKDDVGILSKKIQYELEGREIDYKKYGKILDIEAAQDKTSLVVDNANKYDEFEMSVNNNLNHLTQALYFNWINENRNYHFLSFKNFVVYGQDLEKISQNEALDLESNYIFRESFELVEEDIGHWRPSVVSVIYKSETDVEGIKKIISQTIKYKNYFPFVLVFNFLDKIDIDSFRHKLEYHFVTTLPVEFNYQYVDKLFGLYEKKKLEASDNKNSKILKSTDSDVLLLKEKLIDYPVVLEGEEFSRFGSFEIQLIKLNELEIFFLSEADLKKGQVYYISQPFSAAVYITHTEEGSTEENFKASYKGLLTLLREKDKMALRRYVNSVVSISSEFGNNIKAELILKLKKECFETEG